MLSLRSLTATTAVLLLLLAPTMGDSKEHMPKANSGEHLPEPQPGSEEHDSSSEDKIVENVHGSGERPFFRGHHSLGSGERPFFQGYHRQGSGERPFFQGYGSQGSGERPFFQGYHNRRPWHPPRVMRPPLAPLFTMPPNGIPVLPSPPPFSPVSLGSNPYLPFQPFFSQGFGFGGVASAPFPSYPYYAGHHRHHHKHHRAHHPLAYAGVPAAAVVAGPHDSRVSDDADSEHDRHYPHHLGDLDEKHDGDHHDHDREHGFRWQTPAYAYGPHHYVHPHGPHGFMNAYDPNFHAQAHYANYLANAYGPNFHAHAHYPNYLANAYDPHFHAQAHYANYLANAYDPNFHAQAHYANYLANAYGPNFHAPSPYSSYLANMYGPVSHAQAHYPNYPAYAYGSQFQAYAHDSVDGDEHAYGPHFPAYDYDPDDDDEAYAYGSHLGAYPYNPLMSAYPYGSFQWPMQYKHMWPLHPDQYDAYHSLYWNQGGQCSWENPMPCWGTDMCVPLSSVCDNRFDCFNNVDEDIRLCVSGKRPELQLMTMFFSLPDQAWMINKLFNNRNSVYVAMAFKFATSLHDLKWALSLDAEAVNNTKTVFQAAKDDSPDAAKNLGMQVEQWPVTKFFFRKIMDAGFDVSKE